MQSTGARAQGAQSKLPPLLNEAIVAHRAGQPERAAPLYRQFLDGNPRHPTALQLFGLLCSQQGDYPRAIAFMRRSLEIFPGQAEVENNLGNALARSAALEEAIGSYRRAVELAPGYLDAWRNLGSACIEAGREQEAEEALERCLELAPGDAGSWLALGNLRKRRNRLEDAVSCYRKALEISPAYGEAHHNLGVCLRLLQRPGEALGHYEAAETAGLDRAELHHNRGNALIDRGDVEGAIDAYRKALSRNPADLDSHRNLNSLLWQHERLDDYLGSYRRALQTEPGAVSLRLAFAMALNQQGEHEQAEQALLDGLRHVESSDLTSLLAYTLEGQGRWDDALKLHRRAVSLEGSPPHHRVSYARALLAAGRADEALQQARQGAAQMPYDQRALAYLGLCWRLLGDERDAALNDYDNMVRVYEVPVPAGYDGTIEFNARLGALLHRLHTGKRHPPEQTLRGGSQTSGDLFVLREPEIAGVVAGFGECVRDYLRRLPRHPQHPLFSRIAEGFDFAASWSVRLGRCGYHTMHVHPLGWLSSAYYVEVPRGLAGEEGSLVLGQPDIDIGAAGTPRRRVLPLTGRLVLFPSYMWHGTLPFEAEDPRLTIAFDVVPAGNPR